VTGRLRGTLFGRPVEIEADGRELLVRIADLRSAWWLRRSVSTSMVPLLRTLRRSGLALRMRIGSRLAVNVLPTPGFALRMLVPALGFAKSGDAP